MSNSATKDHSIKRRGIKLALQVLLAGVASFLGNIIVVVALIAASALALYFNVMEDILVIVLLGFCCLFVILYINERRRNPLRRMYPDEITAIESKGGIRDWLKTLPMHSEIRLIGIAGTSIFWMFDMYVQLMSKGYDIEVLNLDIKATNLIDLLAEIEPERDSRKEIDRLIDRLLEMQKCSICPDAITVQDIGDLLEKAKRTSSNREVRLFVFESCSRMWLHARDKAMQIGNLRSSPLRLKYYNQVPYLKVWTTFPPKLCFSGSYLTHPSIGVSNPIVLLDADRSTHDKIIVNKIVEAMKFLSGASSTRAISSPEDILR